VGIGLTFPDKLLEQEQKQVSPSSALKHFETEVQQAYDEPNTSV
jgi:hypothetical protein